MPHVQPEWLIYVVIAIAVLCFSFLVAWRIERKALILTVEEYNDICGYLNDTQGSNRLLTEQNEELAKSKKNAENVRDEWIKKAQDLTGEVEELKKQADEYRDSLKAMDEKVTRVRHFVDKRQLTLRPKKGKLFVAFNEAELSKVLNGEEVA